MNCNNVPPENQNLFILFRMTVRWACIQNYCVPHWNGQMVRKSVTSSNLIYFFTCRCCHSRFRSPGCPKNHTPQKHLAHTHIFMIVSYAFVKQINESKSNLAFNSFLEHIAFKIIQTHSFHSYEITFWIGTWKIY